MAEGPHSNISKPCLVQAGMQGESGAVCKGGEAIGCRGFCFSLGTFKLFLGMSECKGWHGSLLQSLMVGDKKKPNTFRNGFRDVTA